MKVKVKIRREYGVLSHELVALKAVYKTNKSLFKREVNLIRIDEWDSRERTMFAYELECFIKDGNIKERVCEMVKKDIIKRIQEKRKYKKDEDEVIKMLQSVEKIKFTFEMDENDI